MRPCALFMTLVLGGCLAAAEPTVAVTDTTIDVDLGNGAGLVFALDGDRLLGLQQAKIDDRVLSSPTTVQMPIIGQEFGPDRRLVRAMEMQDAKVVDGRVELTVTLLGSGSEAAYRAVFVYTGNKSKAMAALTPALKEVQGFAGQASKALDALIDKHPDVVAVQAQRDELQQKADAGDKRAKKSLRGFDKKKMPAARNGAKAALVKENPEAQSLRKRISDFQAAMAAYANKEFGLIHRDFYRFPHIRLPADICRIEHVKSVGLNGLEPMGSLVWILEPHSEVIGGWVWQGWKQSYRFVLAGDRQINCVRQIGTWEIDGDATGLTAVALRYRGLGRIQQQFTATESGGVAEAWSTTEMIPGAAGGTYAVSPVMPASTSVNDRGYAMRHRNGAWICRPARGGAAPFVDFQFRDDLALISFHERQGNLRSLSEVQPGDKTLSQTDEQYFALTSSGTTQPQVYLALQAPQAWAINEWQTRWQEVDQHVRDMVAAELGFVQFEVLPGVGTIASGQPVSLMSQYGKMADAWHKQGVRLVASHSPGWTNREIFRDGKVQPTFSNGGECTIADWLPPEPMHAPWQKMQKAFAAKGISYHPWIGQTIMAESPFVDRVGKEKHHWSLNTPFDEHGPGYAPAHVKGNIFDDAFRNEFQRCLQTTRTDYGYQGIWVDSFQNLMMSQLAWSDGSANSMQRTWWEVIAGWTRDGVAMMSESHAFPGLSCSIEIKDWEKDLIYYQHVWKWLRAGGQDRYDAAKLEAMAFRLMAVKGWLAPDQAYGLKEDLSIPRFGEFANSFLAVRRDMRRSYVLPDDAGVLWLPYGSNHTGICFAFGDMGLPAGVTAMTVLDDTAADALQHHTVYRLAGSDLRQAFGMAIAGQNDERMQKTYTEPQHFWPAWAKEGGE